MNDITEVLESARCKLLVSSAVLANWICVVGMWSRTFLHYIKKREREIERERQREREIERVL